VISQSTPAPCTGCGNTLVSARPDGSHLCASCWTQHQIEWMPDVTREPGEIVALGGQAFEVFVKDVRDVTIGGQPLNNHDGRLVAMSITENDLVCLRLALVAGDRLKVKQ
jgi:hypothetical protein